MNRTRAVLIAILFVALLPLSVSAEDGYNAQLFQPSIFGGNFIAIEDAETLCSLGFSAGLLLNYANGPVEIRIDDDPEMGILNQLFTADVLLGFGPFSWWSVGVDVPVHLMARTREFGDIEEGTDVSGLTDETSLGDIRAEFKFKILQQQKHWLGMALAPYATFPTGDETKFLGEGRVAGGGNLAIERDFKVLNVGLNGGYMYRGDAELATINVGDAWKMGAGVSRAFDNGLSFSVEYWGSWIDSGSVDKFQANPMEVMGTLRYQFGERGPRVIGGAAGGLTSGVGCPAYRLMAGADYRYCKPEPTLGKLLILVVDQNDKPLPANLKIVGPKALETKTEDNAKWKSPMPPGEYLITASKPGYSSATAEKVVELGKTAKVKIKLMLDPTLLKVIVTDKFTGEKIKSRVIFDKGTDNEKIWKLPEGERVESFKPGKYKVVASAKGYETRFVKTTVKENKTNVLEIQLRKKIEKIGKIYFDFDSDVIRKKSYPVLDDVVSKINSLGQFQKIIIEGHCSSEGTDEYNMDLSTRRSTSVKKYLVNKGIDGTKLDIEPYGESRPIATNDTETGRGENRRVEFIIEE
jgi:outer membrane protein OmpA-like peptidoglycan-associated protein